MLILSCVILTLHQAIRVPRHTFCCIHFTTEHIQSGTTRCEEEGVSASACHTFSCSRSAGSCLLSSRRLVTAFSRSACLAGLRACSTSCLPVWPSATRRLRINLSLTYRTRLPFIVAFSLLALFSSSAMNSRVLEPLSSSSLIFFVFGPSSPRHFLFLFWRRSASCQ